MCSVWLVNTGWTGGPYGTGTRMKIAHTRAMIRAALAGALDNVAYETDPVFNLSVPDVVSRRAARSAQAAEHVEGSPRPTTSRRASSREMFADNFKAFEADAARGRARPRDRGNAEC